MKHISGGEGEPYGWLMMSLAVNRHRELDSPYQRNQHRRRNARCLSCNTSSRSPV